MTPLSHELDMNDPIEFHYALHQSIGSSCQPAHNASSLDTRRSKHTQANRRAGSFCFASQYRRCRFAQLLHCFNAQQWLHKRFVVLHQTADVVACNWLEIRGCFIRSKYVHQKLYSNRSRILTRFNLMKSKFF